jgi:hypothetical protein
MSTYLVNQELAKHRYATLMREASSHRLAKEPQGMSDGPVTSPSQQMTWALRMFARYRALRPAIGAI